MRIVLFIVCLLTSVTVQAQILTMYELTTQQHDYIEWVGKGLIQEVSSISDLQTKILSNTDARPETIRMKWTFAKLTYAQSQALFNEWRKRKHPAPFHQTDSLFGSWIMRVDSLALAYLNFYSEYDSLHAYSKPALFESENDAGILLVSLWQTTWVDLQTAARTVSLAAQMEAMALPRKKE